MKNTPSEKIYVLINILNEIQKLNIKNPTVVTSNSRSENRIIVHRLSCSSMIIVADNINIPVRRIEYIMTDINAIDIRGFQIFYFYDNIINRLITGDKSALKKLLMKNIKFDYDIEYINNWYE